MDNNPIFYAQAQTKLNNRKILKVKSKHYTIKTQTPQPIIINIVVIFYKNITKI